jgi:hypothetical protein
VLKSGATLDEGHVHVVQIPKDKSILDIIRSNIPQAHPVLSVSAETAEIQGWLLESSLSGMFRESIELANAVLRIQAVLLHANAVRP